jgi:hypothetical protein
MLHLVMWQSLLLGFQPCNARIQYEYFRLSVRHHFDGIGKKKPLFACPRPRGGPLAPHFGAYLATDSIQSWKLVSETHWRAYVL